MRTYIFRGRQKATPRNISDVCFCWESLQIKGRREKAKQINNKRMETKLQKFAKFDKWWPGVATS